MIDEKSNPKYTRDEFGRTTEEVPFFPFSHVRMTTSHTPADSIEEAQYDFVKQAGMPSMPQTPTDDDTED